MRHTTQLIIILLVLLSFVSVVSSERIGSIDYDDYLALYFGNGTSETDIAGGKGVWDTSAEQVTVTSRTDYIDEVRASHIGEWQLNISGNSITSGNITLEYDAKSINSHSTMGLSGYRACDAGETGCASQLYNSIYACSLGTTDYTTISYGNGATNFGNTLTCSESFDTRGWLTYVIVYDITNDKCSFAVFNGTRMICNNNNTNSHHTSTNISGALTMNTGDQGRGLSLDNISIYAGNGIVDGKPSLPSPPPPPPPPPVVNYSTFTKIANSINITSSINGNISSVTLQVTDPYNISTNYSMSDISNNIYNYMYKMHQSGLFKFMIFVNDSSGNWNKNYPYFYSVNRTDYYYDSGTGKYITDSIEPVGQDKALDGVTETVNMMLKDHSWTDKETYPFSPAYVRYLYNEAPYWGGGNYPSGYFPATYSGTFLIAHQMGGTGDSSGSLQFNGTVNSTFDGTIGMAMYVRKYGSFNANIYSTSDDVGIYAQSSQPHYMYSSGGTCYYQGNMLLWDNKWVKAWMDFDYDNEKIHFWVSDGNNDYYCGNVTGRGVNRFFNYIYIMNGHSNEDLFIDNVWVTNGPLLRNYGYSESSSSCNYSVCSDALVCDYTSIQSAINGVPSGSTVCVYDGIYNEGMINVTNGITLTGNGNGTVIRGGFKVTANNVNINKFNITNGFQTQDENLKLNLDDISDNDERYPYIAILSTGNYTLFDSNYIWNVTGQKGANAEGYSGGDGIGIYVNNAINNTIKNNIIVYSLGGVGGNSGTEGTGGAGGTGIGILARNSQSISVYSNLITNVTGGDGGWGDNFGSGGTGGKSLGIGLITSSDILVYSNQIVSSKGGKGWCGYYNSAIGKGGNAVGLYLSSSSIGNTFYSNLMTNLVGGLGNGDDYGNCAVAPNGKGVGIWLKDSGSFNNIVTRLSGASPDSTYYNKIDNQPIFYFYDNDGLQFTSKNIALSGVITVLIDGGEENGGYSDGGISTAVALINVDNALIQNNVISGVVGSGGVSGRNGAVGKKGGSSSAVYLYQSTNNTITSNNLFNITGGKGGTSGAYTHLSARTIVSGGISTGIYLDSGSVSNNIYSNNIHNNTGGEGSNFAYTGWESCVVGGTGGYSTAIYLKSSTSTVYMNSISNMTGGCGGVGASNCASSGGRGGNATGFIFESANSSVIFNNTVQQMFGGLVGSSGGTPGSSNDTAMLMISSTNNTIYNNFFNVTDGIQISGTSFTNYYYITPQAGTRIYTIGTQIGGNYYANYPCSELIKDGFCDNAFTFDSNNKDLYPLTDLNTLVSACGTVIISSGTYTLTSNISNSNIDGACININASDVVFDCGGNIIDSVMAEDNDNTKNDYGVYSDKNNITVRNCKISQFQVGIGIAGSNSLVENNYIYNIWGTEDTSGSTIATDGRGIEVLGSNNIIRYNYINNVDGGRDYPEGSKGKTASGIYIGSDNNYAYYNNVTDIMGGKGRQTSSSSGQDGTGGDGFAVYLKNADYNNITNIRIWNVDGGTRSSYGAGEGMGGMGGNAFGVYLSASTNNIVNDVVMYDIDGSEGGGTSCSSPEGVGGTGGMGGGIGLESSTDNIFKLVNISDLSGGAGGTYCSYAEGARGVTTGVWFRDIASYNNLLTPTVVSGSYNVPDSSIYNILEGKPLLYFYNQVNLNVSEYNIDLSVTDDAPFMLMGNYQASEIRGGNASGIVLINVNNSLISHNTIKGYYGMSPISFKYNQDMKYGGDGFGIYLKNGNGNTIDKNIISDIQGGQGGSCGKNCVSGGTGGNGIGIETVDSNNNVISENDITGLVASPGGYCQTGEPTCTSSMGIMGTKYPLYMLSTTLSTINGNNLVGNYSILMSGSSSNLIYNNMINATTNYVQLINTVANSWNTSKQAGTRIWGAGSYIAGNSWHNATGGFSLSCIDNNQDGLCEDPLTLATDNIDYLPLGIPDYDAPVVVWYQVVVLPDLISFNLTASVYDVQHYVSEVKVEITSPSLVKTNYTMSLLDGTIYNLTYTATESGEYTFVIYAVDISGNVHNPPFYSRNVYYFDGKYHLTDHIGDGIALNGEAVNIDDSISTGGWEILNGDIRYSSGEDDKAIMIDTQDDWFQYRLNTSNSSFSGSIGFKANISAWLQGSVYFGFRDATPSFFYGATIDKRDGWVGGWQFSAVGSQVCDLNFIPIVFNSPTTFIYNWTSSTSMTSYIDGVACHTFEVNGLSRLLEAGEAGIGNVGTGVQIFDIWVSNTNSRPLVSDYYGSFYVDFDAPSFSSQQRDITPYLNDYVNMSVIITELNPGSYKFAWNVSGEYVNDSPVSYVGGRVSTVKLISSPHNNICWKYWANDTYGNEAESDVDCFTVADTAPSVALVSPQNGEILYRNTSPSLSVLVNDIDGDLLDVKIVDNDNGVVLSTQNGVSSGSTVSYVWENREANTVYTWYANVTDGTLLTQSTIWNFDPNDEPKTYNMRVEQINDSTVLVKWENEPDMEWISLRVGSDIMELRHITGVEQEWLVQHVYKDSQYVFEWQIGDNLTAMSDYYNFDFRTRGWKPDLSSYGYKRLMTVDKDSLGSPLYDFENYAVNISLTDENFQYFDGVNWVWYPSFTHLNWTNYNDIRFVNYYDTEYLPFEITSINCPGEGGLNTQTIPDEIGYTGTFTDFAYSHDGDWNTEMIPNTYGEYYYNYTLSVGAKTTSKFRIYDGNWGWDIPIPSDCFGGSKLQFKSESDYVSPYVKTYCLNNSDDTWVMFRENDESSYIYETMVTFEYDCEVNINVKPQHFNDNTQHNTLGVDKDYDTKFYMYYGKSDAVNNETSSLTSDGMVVVSSVGDEEPFVAQAPIISNLDDTQGRTSTGTNISWNVDQATDNMVEYSTNEWILDSTWASRLVNNTETFLHIYSDMQSTVLLKAYSNEYIGTVDISCDGCNHSSSYVLNISLNPVTLTFLDVNDTEYHDWTVTYTWNLSVIRDSIHPVFKLEDLVTDTTYYYRVLSMDTYNSTATGSFILGTPPSTPSCTIYNYTEDRPANQVTVCGELTDMNGEGNVDMSIQYWNEDSVDISETTADTLTGTGTFCKTINVDYGHTYYYRSKCDASTTGYSDAYINEFMPVQEFFAGSYIEDDNDDRDRQYCPPSVDGTVNLSAKCYEQKGYLEGSQRLEDWVWIETNISDKGDLTVNWFDGSSWTPYSMTNDTDTNMKYLLLNNLGSAWQTFYVTGYDGEVVLNWTKPGLIHLNTKNRVDVQKYVSFSGSTSSINYKIEYMEPENDYDSTAYRWCMTQPGGNLYDCMAVEYWGGGIESGLSPDLIGTAYDRGQLFRGGIINGEPYDTGVLNPTRDATNKAVGLSEYRGCFAFTVFWWNDTVIPTNNITNYYYRYWTMDKTWSEYLGYPQDRLFDYVNLFEWRNDLLSFTRDWAEISTQPNPRVEFEPPVIADTRMTTQNVALTGISNDTFNTPYNQSLVWGYKNGFSVDVHTNPYSIYDTGFYTDGRWTNQQLGKYQQGFVIFNLPDNSTLQGLDSDSDGLNDYDELFVYYTNPFSNDTDEGGKTDNVELLLGLNPNIYTDDTIQPPSYSDNRTNSTLTSPKYGEDLKLDATIYSLPGLVSYRLAHNGNGVMTNYSIVNISGSGSYNVSVIVQNILLVKGQTFQWQLWAEDTYGQVSTSDIFTVSMKNTQPSMPVIYSPQNIGYISSDINVSYSSSDVDNDAISYYIRINDSLITVSLVNQTLSMLDGSYVLKVSAYDGTSFSVNSTPVTFTVDTVGPEITFLTIVNYETYNSIPLYINFSTNEPSNCTINNSLWNLVTSTPTYYSFADDNTTPQQYYDVLVSCYDLYNNFNSEVISFTLDRIRPVIVHHTIAKDNSTSYYNPLIFWNNVTITDNVILHTYDANITEKNNPSVVMWSYSNKSIGTNVLDINVMFNTETWDNTTYVYDNNVCNGIECVREVYEFTFEVPVPPVITVYSPTTYPVVDVGLGQTIPFDVEVTDDNAQDYITYEWTVDYVGVSTNEDYDLSVNEGHIGLIYNVMLTAYDNSIFNMSTSKYWNVTVISGHYQEYESNDLSSIIINGLGTAGASIVDWIDLIVIVFVVLIVISMIVYGISSLKKQ